MANDEHLALLKQGVDVWNDWRERNPEIKPDFRGAKLENKELEGANFNNADIRGANFTNAKLQRATFTKARAGLQESWAICFVILSWLFAGIAAWCFQSMIGNVVALILDPSNPINLIVGVIASILVIILLAATLFEGIIITALPAAIVISLIAGVVANASGIGPGTATVIGAAAVSGFGAAALVMTVSLALTGAFIGGGERAANAAGVVAVVVAAAFIINGEDRVERVGLTLVLALMIAITGILLGWRSIMEDEKDAWIRTRAVTVASMKGTGFCGATLTDADFTDASLKNTDFRKAILTRTCWKNAQQLNFANVGDSILSQTSVRDLLISHDGNDKSYVGANLEGAYLAGADLYKAILRKANLNGANLQEAILEEANLTEVKAIGTNFANSKMTGVCLEAWKTESTTIFKQVDCDYYFLKEKRNHKGVQERNPYDQDRIFDPGEFEALQINMKSTIKILLRNGFNRGAFALAFGELIKENPEITPDSLQQIERKGNNILFAIEVPEGTDLGQLERDFNTIYHPALQAAQKTAHLEAEKPYNEDLKEISKNSVHRSESPLRDIVINIDNNFNPLVTSDSSFMPEIYRSKYDQRYSNNQFIDRAQSGSNPTFDQHICALEQKNLADAVAEIQQLLTQLQSKGFSQEEIQQIVAQDLAKKAQGSPTLMDKLVRWGESLGDTAAKTTVGEAAKEVFKLALRLLAR